MSEPATKGEIQMLFTGILLGVLFIGLLFIGTFWVRHDPPQVDNPTSEQARSKVR